MKKLPPRSWDWPSTSLLIVMMAIASARLWATEWTPNLGLTQTAAFLGCALGLALGFSGFRPRNVALIAGGYSLIVLPWLWLHIIVSHESTWQRLASVGGRLNFAFRAITAQQRVEDFIFFVVLMTTLFWLIALFSGYQLARNTNLLAALLPAGLGMVVIDLYDILKPERLSYLGIYLLLSLILLGRHNLLQNDARWHERHMAASSEIRIDISTGIVIAAIALLSAAWLLPVDGFSFAPVENTWHSIDEQFAATRKRLSDMLAAVTNYVPSGGSPNFGPEMSLGRSAARGEDVLFEVEAPVSAHRYYWRARVYEIYNNGLWSEGRTFNRSFSPENNAPLAASAYVTNKISLIFKVEQPQTTLLAVNDPFWISREATAIFGYTDAPTNDLIAVNATTIVRSGERYEIQSVVPDPTLILLRGAGTDYPAWVKDRYLQLPRTFPKKIKTLAEEITVNAKTPYDQAAAITDYLRANITYSETVTSTDPFRGDPIAWMLFNGREGFCNYYASAEVLMLRTLGIPARLAVGYAQGQDINTTTHRVRNKDAHAWPEVYFPNIGWVEFEPTSAQPAIIRPLGDTPESVVLPPVRPTLSIDEVDQEPANTAEQSTASDSHNIYLSPQLVQWVIILSVGGAWAGFLIYLSRRQPLSVRLPRFVAQLFIRYHLSLPGWLQDWLRWTEQTPAERAFESINRCLRILGKPQPIHATPSERADILSDLLPEASVAITQLTHDHIGALFGPVSTVNRNAWQAVLVLYFNAFRYYFRSAR